MQVPGLLGGHTLVYLPLLNYSDRCADDLPELTGPWQGRRFQARVLDFACTDFAEGDTVTMRLDIAGLSPQEVFTQRIHSKCRNQIRKSQRGELGFEQGRSGKVRDDFYAVFAATMHRYGTPVFSRRLFECLPAHLDVCYLMAYHGQTPVAGLCLVMDEQIAWVPWAGSDMAHRALCPNHLIYWHAIEQAANEGKQVFDFGRSAYLGPTYAFKQDWGARPVRIMLASDQPSDVYAKYSLASSVWQRLPRVMVDAMGPVLCKRLPDL